MTQTAADGGAQLTTSDSSCTSPAIPGAGMPFNSSSYDGALLPGDGGPTGITRTREGMIEVIAIADITAGSALDVATSHVQNGTPAGGIPPCTQSLITPYYAGEEDMVAPTSGLAGSVAIVNVGQGTFFGYNADALTGFTEVPLIVPQVLFGESLQQANTADSSFSGGATAHLLTTEGKPLALDYEHGIDAVSAVFAADALQNEYFIDSNLGANTDWVVTFPTKAYYVDPYYVGSASAGGDTVSPPFSETFSRNVDGQSNSAFSAAVYDREEGQATDAPAEIGPPISHPDAFSYQVNVLGFATPPTDVSTSAVLGSSLIVHWNFAQFGTAGWALVDLASGDDGHALLPDRNGIVLRGLPVTGFMVYNIINANAQPGMLANYGGTFAHRSTMSCDATTSCP